MDTSLKKRNRIPSSCSICRKRKSKCDRTKPVCGSCKKKSIAHLCFYETDKAAHDKLSDNLKNPSRPALDVYANGSHGIATDPPPPPSSNHLHSNIPSPLSSTNPALQTPNYFYHQNEPQSNTNTIDSRASVVPLASHMISSNGFPYQQIAPPPNPPHPPHPSHPSHPSHPPHPPHAPTMPPQMNHPSLSMGSNVYHENDHFRQSQPQTFHFCQINR